MACWLLLDAGSASTALSSACHDEPAGARQLVKDSFLRRQRHKGATDDEALIQLAAKKPAWYRRQMNCKVRSALELAEALLEWVVVHFIKQDMSTGIPLVTRQALQTALVQIMLALKDGFSGTSATVHSTVLSTCCFSVLSTRWGTDMLCISWLG